MRRCAPSSPPTPPESWSRIYRLPLTTVVKPATATLIGRLARNCVTLDGFALRTKIGMLRLAYQLRNVNLAASPRWAALMQQNSVTPAGLTMPLLIAQRSKDQIVAPAVTRGLVDRLCAARATVRFLPIEGGDHVSVGKRSADTALRWFGDRFANRPAPNDCRRLRSYPHAFHLATPGARGETDGEGEADVRPVGSLDS